MKHLITLAAERESQEVTDWAERVGWVVGLLLFVVLLYWLMRQGWKWRGTLQSDLPELPGPPAETGAVRLRMTGRYHGSTTAGQWLDRVVAHGLGVRSRAELTLTDEGVEIRRPGATDFFVPAHRLCGARLDTGIAGKVLTEGGLLVITWNHGTRQLDSGFRSDRAAEHPEWVTAVRSLLPDRHDGIGANGSTARSPGSGTLPGTTADDAGVVAPHHQEGAR